MILDFESFYCITVDGKVVYDKLFTTEEEADDFMYNNTYTTEACDYEIINFQSFMEDNLKGQK